MGDDSSLALQSFSAAYQVADTIISLQRVYGYEELSDGVYLLNAEISWVGSVNKGHYLLIVNSPNVVKFLFGDSALSCSVTRSWDFSFLQNFGFRNLLLGNHVRLTAHNNGRTDKECSGLVRYLFARAGCLVIKTDQGAFDLVCLRHFEYIKIRLRG